MHQLPVIKTMGFVAKEFTFHKTHIVQSVAIEVVDVFFYIYILAYVVPPLVHLHKNNITVSVVLQLYWRLPRVIRT